MLKAHRNHSTSEQHPSKSHLSGLPGTLLHLLPVPLSLLSPQSYSMCSSVNMQCLISSLWAIWCFDPQQAKFHIIFSQSTWRPALIQILRLIQRCLSVAPYLPFRLLHWSCSVASQLYFTLSLDSLPDPTSPLSEVTFSDYVFYSPPNCSKVRCMYPYGASQWNANNWIIFK